MRRGYGSEGLPCKQCIVRQYRSVYSQSKGHVGQAMLYDVHIYDVHKDM